MNKTINEGGVKAVNTTVTGNGPCHLVSTFIHHELTPERISELTTLLEGIIVRAAATWAKL